MVDGKLEVFPFVEARGLLFLQFRKRELILSAGPYIGLIPLTPKFVVEVKPKLPVDNLARILDTARSSLSSLSGIDRHYLVERASSASVLEFVAGNLIAGIENIISFGLYKTYAQRSEITSQPRGRIDMAGTLRYCWSRGQMHQVHVHRFEQTPDIAVNRVLKAALEFILTSGHSWSGGKSAIVSLANILYRELPKTIGSLRNNDIVQCEKIIDEKSLPSMRSYYYRALDIAILILKNESISLQIRGDDIALDTFIVNFEDLFEMYLRRLLHARSEAKFSIRDGNREGRKPLFDDRKAPPAQPDIVIICNGTGKKVIAEVKYKEKPSRDDINQAITYALSYKTDTVVLVHQRKPSGPKGLQTIGLIGGIRLSSYGFDLSNTNLDEEEKIFSTAMFSLAGNR